MDDELPPLPPPLPPTHSRSFSSSSSSSAGSPQPRAEEWGRRTATNGRNDAGTRLGNQQRQEYFSPARVERGEADASSVRATRSPPSDTSSNDSPTSIRDSTFPRSSPTTARPSPRSSQSPTSTLTYPHDSNPSDSSLNQRTRAFLSKVSPSLSSHTRYSNSPHNIASLGLRGSPEPLGLGIGSGGFSRHLGGLPSPPPTNSDEGSMEGGSRYGTLRASEIDEASNVDGNESQAEGNQSPAKPDRPPKSERRSTSTPTKESDNFPTIERVSPTIAGSTRGTPHRPNDLESYDGFRRSSSVSSFHRDTSPSPSSSRLTPSTSMRSVDRYASDEAGSDAMEELRDGLAGVEPRRRMRARSSSVDPDQAFDTGSAERRREKQSKKAHELREKNQRASRDFESLVAPELTKNLAFQVLDSINSQLDPLISPPASNRASSPAPSSDSVGPRQTVQRSSTSSTIRNLAAGDDDLLHGTLPNFSTHGSSTDEEEPRRRGLGRAASSSASDMGEFGMAVEGSIRRSATVGDIASQDSTADRERRAQTSGFQSRPRTSLGRRNLEDQEKPLPERSATSMSSYPSTIERIRARRSDLVGSERTRAASSFSDTRQQDQDFSEGMRRLASRELLRTPRERATSQSQAFDSPSPASQSQASKISPATLRNRPALPSEFRESPSSSSISSSRNTPRRSLDTSSSRLTPSSSSSRDLDRFARSRSAVPSLASPISPTTTSTSFPASHRPARSEVSFDDDHSANGVEEQERERTPKSARKSTFDRVSSVGRARTSLGTPDRRANSVSEIIDRPYSRMSREGRRSDLRSSGAASPSTAMPAVPSSVRSQDRYGTSSDLAARRERLQNAEVGSEAWMAELDNLRHRGARSRASGSSIDGRSAAGDGPTRSPSDADRDRTVRAINALLAGQGIVATAVDPASPTATSTSPRKRDSVGAYDRNRKISFANGTHEASQLPPGSNTMSRSSSTASRLGSDPPLQIPQDFAFAGEHHKLLLSAFDHFDRHFSQEGADSPESSELVKRMVALIGSTTKLNSGLRALSESIKEEQIQAQLDEAARDSTVALGQFEKSVHALLRSSDDQVRNLSEDLIAMTRADRERHRLRRESDGLSRPVSRATNIQPPLLLQSPPRRPTTAGSFDGATVSLSSSRSPNVTREVLRNPLEEPADPFPARRGTLNFPGRSPFSKIGTDSPTPASRRSGSSSETPVRRESISTSSTYSSGTTGGRPGNRRGKSSDPTRSPTQTGAVPFPTTSVPIPRVDSTPALSNESPTRPAHSFPKRPVDGPPRTYSGASGDAIAYEALELAANLDEARIRKDRAAALDRLETARSQSPGGNRSIVSTPTSEIRRPRTRSSMGAIGSALKNAFTPKKKGAESTAAVSSASSQFSSYSIRPRDSVDSGSPDDTRRERRREVENILRRSTSRTT
ncbi:hypothetical protein JCM16303_005242 [Sporobolomyces ruberrimus]